MRLPYSRLSYLLIYLLLSLFSVSTPAATIDELIQSAEQGNLKAQSHLGYMYYVGEGVKQDYVEAVKWYRQAAAQGDRDAQYNLAVAYAFGEGVKQDHGQAATWYRRAAEQSHIIAQYSLGLSYAYGEGVPQDTQEAANWFEKAAKQGYARAQVHLASMYHIGDGVGRNFKEAAKWYRKAADRGNPTAQYNLGSLYRSGKGVTQDINQAKRWFRLAADQGYAPAQNELASLNLRPKPSPNDLPEIEQAEIAVSTKTEPPVNDTETRQPVTETPQVAEPAVTTEASAERVDSEVAKTSDSIAKPIVNTGVTAVETASEVATVTSETVVETATDSTTASSAGLFGFLGGLFSSGEDDIEENSDTDSNINQRESVANEKPTPTVFEGKQETDSSDKDKHNLLSIFETTEDTELNSEEAIVETEVEVAANDWSRPSTETVDSEAPETEIVETDDTTFENETELSNVNHNESTPLAVEEVTDTANDEIVEDEISIEPAEEKIVSESASGEDVDEPSFFERLFGTDKTETASEEDSMVNADIADESVADNADSVMAEEASVTEAIELESGTHELAVTTDSETVAEIVDEDIAETMVELPSADAEVSNVADIDSSAEDIIVADTETEPLLESDTEADTEEKTSGISGFFSRLFGTSEAETETVKNTESETDVPEEIIAYVEAEETLYHEQHDNEVQITTLEAETFEPETATSLQPPPVTDETLNLAESTSEPLAEPAEQQDPLILAAEAGDAQAQKTLADRYHQTTGTGQDYAAARRWYVTAAEQGNVDAQYALGNIYLMGEGTQQDNVQAYHWYKQAAEQGHEAATGNARNLERVFQQQGLSAEDIETRLLAENTNTIDTEVTADVETSVAETDTELAPFISELFEAESPETMLTETDENSRAEQVPEPVTETVEETIAETSLDKIDADSYESTSAVDSDEVADSELVAMPTEIQNETEVEAEETQASAGFFSKLFGTGDNAESSAITTEEKINAEAEAEIVMEATADNRSDMATESDENELATLFDESFNENNKAATNATEEVVENSAVDEQVEEIVEAVALLEEQHPLAGLERQALSGDIQAAYELANAYYAGEQVQQDYQQAREWYVSAANQGHAESQFSLGNMYLMGEGVEQDDQSALDWYQQAANQGHTSARHNYDNLNTMLNTASSNTAESGAVVSEADPEPTLEAIDETITEVSEVPSTPALDSDAEENYQKGLAYVYGDGVEKDLQLAFGQFLKAANQGHTAAQYRIATAYAYGEGVTQDYQQAAEWYGKAAKSGDLLAQRQLAKLYWSGKGVEKNRAMAHAWYSIIANHGDLMDRQRLDMLKQEMTSEELDESRRLSNELSQL